MALLADGVLLAFPVCCHGCAEIGLLVPAVRGEVSLSNVPVPSYLDEASGKMQRESRMKGDV